MGPQIEKSIWDQSGINPGFNPGGSWIVNLGPRLKSIWVLDCQSGSQIDVNLGPGLSIWVPDWQSGTPQIDNSGPPRLKNQSGINLGSIRDSILEGGIPDLSYLLNHLSFYLNHWIYYPWKSSQPTRIIFLLSQAECEKASCNSSSGANSDPQFRCDNGQCISAKWKCDFENDCQVSEQEVLGHP